MPLPEASWPRCSRSARDGRPCRPLIAPARRTAALAPTPPPTPGVAPGLTGVLYVSPVGDPDPARNTLRAFPTIEAAWAARQNGDTIVVLPGVHSLPSTLTPSDGIDNNAIVGLGGPVFVSQVGTPITLSSTNQSNAFWKRLTIEGLTFVGGDAIVFDGPQTTAAAPQQPFDQGSGRFVVSHGMLLLRNLVLVDGSVIRLTNVGAVHIENLTSQGDSNGALACSNVQRLTTQSVTNISLSFVGDPTTFFPVHGEPRATLRGFSTEGSISVGGCVWVDADRSVYVGNEVNANNPPLFSYQDPAAGTLVARLFFHGDTGYFTAAVGPDDVGGAPVPFIDLEQARFRNVFTVAKEVGGARMGVSLFGATFRPNGSVGVAGPVDLDARDISGVVTQWSTSDSATIRRSMLFLNVSVGPTPRGPSIVFDTDMPDANYAVLVTPRSGGETAQVTVRTAQGVTIECPVAATVDVQIIPAR